MAGLKKLGKKIGPGDWKLIGDMVRIGRPDVPIFPPKLDSWHGLFPSRLQRRRTERRILGGGKGGRRVLFSKRGTPPTYFHNFINPTCTDLPFLAGSN